MTRIKIQGKRSILVFIRWRFLRSSNAIHHFGDEMIKRTTDCYFFSAYSTNALNFFLSEFTKCFHIIWSVSQIPWYHLWLLMKISSDANWSSEYHAQWTKSENKLIIWCFNNRKTPQYSQRSWWNHSISARPRLMPNAR